MTDAWMTVKGVCEELVFAFLFPKVKEHLPAVDRMVGVTTPDMIGIHGIWISALPGIVCV